MLLAAHEEIPDILVLPAVALCDGGWHVPTRAECFALCGNSNKSADEDATQYDETALFYDSAYPAGKVSLAYGHYETGMQVRCVKDSE